VLADLGVRVVKIGTVYERMNYDKETIAVQAGKPVLFVLHNSDVMPHNFVIARPGTMQELGELAETSSQNPAFAKQSFVPQSPNVLAASALMQPQASQRVTFSVPTEPGVYPYVCTYPGHWRRMFGAMYVVDDLEGYLADPAGYLAAHPLPIKDALLQDRRPRTEWTLADLESSVTAMGKGEIVRAWPGTLPHCQLRVVPQARRCRQRLRSRTGEARGEDDAARDHQAHPRAVPEDRREVSLDHARHRRWPVDHGPRRGGDTDRGGNRGKSGGEGRSGADQDE
jgi:azurin